jgi:hypothetical protein
MFDEVMWEVIVSVTGFLLLAGAIVVLGRGSRC